MGLLEDFYPESRFGGYSAVDGTVKFYSRVRALLTPDMVVLDVGCGRGAALREDPVPYRRDLRLLRGRCKRVIGLDVDPAGESNPGLDEFVLLQSTTWPIENGYIDLIVCDFVLEHVDSPVEFFSEVQRVLKPGGFFCARTPNKYGYVAVAARLIPDSLHQSVLKVAQPSRHEADSFPTIYKANTVGSLRELLNKIGLGVPSMAMRQSLHTLDLREFSTRQLRCFTG